MKPIRTPRLWWFIVIVALLIGGTTFAASQQHGDAENNVYVVQAGDSLSKIARNLGISVDDLLAANPQITNPNAIYVGQHLNLPGVSNALPNPQVVIDPPPIPTPLPEPTIAPLPTGNIAEKPTLPAVPQFPVSASQSVGLLPVVTGFQNPVYLTHAGDQSGRVFVVEQRGIVWIVENGVINPVPFLNINQQVLGNTSEKGFLGLAFHPNYAQNGYVFGHYSNLAGDTVVARWTVSTDANLIDPATQKTVLQIPQPFVNHNGGQLSFGPDGYLYLGLGDGGGGGDPLGHGQNASTPFGAILRIDINVSGTYAIPPSNPYVNGGGAPEVWATGLRNPWRFSFDRATGNLFVADVGQNEYEEISLIPAGVGGLNLGWNVLEGNHCYAGAGTCDPAPYLAPIAEYDHSLGCSVTGGYVYRGVEFPSLFGTYLYSDYCTGTIWGLREVAPGDLQTITLAESGLFVSSFGEDEAGEVYVLDYIGGAVYKIVGQ